MIDGIKKTRPNVVFNLFEGLPELGQTEAYAAGIMDWLLFQKGFLNYGLEEDNLKKRVATFQWLESQAVDGRRLPQDERTPTTELEPQFHA